MGNAGLHAIRASLAVIAGRPVTAAPGSAPEVAGDGAIDALGPPGFARFYTADTTSERVAVPRHLVGLDGPAQFQIAGKTKEDPARSVDYPPMTHADIVPFAVQRVENAHFTGLKIATDSSGPAWLLAGVWDREGRPVVDPANYDAALKTMRPVVNQSGSGEALQIVRMSHVPVHERTGTHHQLVREHEVYCVVVGDRIAAVAEHERVSETWRINHAGSDFWRSDGVPTGLMVHVWIGVMAARDRYSEPSVRSWSREEVRGALINLRDEIPAILSAPLLRACDVSEPTLLAAMQRTMLYGTGADIPVSGLLEG